MIKTSSRLPLFTRIALTPHAPLTKQFRSVAPVLQGEDQKSHTPYTLPHPIWPNEYLDAVKQIHTPPATKLDKLAYWSVQLLRFNFDWMTGYAFGKITPKKVLTRAIFLETVAGVPGSVAGILRHLRSLRRMERDHGWIHTLFEEAENERLHLLTFLELRKPGRFMRTAVFVSQGVFFNFFFFAYLISPTYCHRFVGYLEESAVKTYSHILHEIDHGELKDWKTMPAPTIAIDYWKLPKEATVRDVVAVIRADEAHHRDVNHTFSAMKPEEQNPFPPGQ